MPTKVRSGLDLPVPERGAAADAYFVAQTAQLLYQRTLAKAAAEPGHQFQPHAASRHAVTLHRISGMLHRLSERQCSEDLTCPRCGGDGRVLVEADDSEEIGAPIADPRNPSNWSACCACAGRGLTTGRRQARLERQATEIAEHYGLRAYFQGDPRGCSLYLIDPAIIPQHGKDLHAYAYGKPTPLAELQARWVSANYSRGHAVCGVGR